MKKIISFILAINTAFAAMPVRADATGCIGEQCGTRAAEAITANAVFGDGDNLKDIGFQALDMCKKFLGVGDANAVCAVKNDALSDGTNLTDVGFQMLDMCKKVLGLEDANAVSTAGNATLSDEKTFTDPGFQMIASCMHGHFKECLRGATLSAGAYVSNLLLTEALFPLGTDFTAGSAVARRLSSAGGAWLMRAVYNFAADPNFYRQVALGTISHDSCSERLNTFFRLVFGPVKLELVDVVNAASMVATSFFGAFQNKLYDFMMGL